MIIDSVRQHLQILKSSFLFLPSLVMGGQNGARYPQPFLIQIDFGTNFPLQRRDNPFKEVEAAIDEIQGTKSIAGS